MPVLVQFVCMHAFRFQCMCVCMCAYNIGYTCGIALKKKKRTQKSLYQSVTMSHRFPNVNMSERKASIPRQGLGAASRSPRR